MSSKNVLCVQHCKVMADLLPAEQTTYDFRRKCCCILQGCNSVTVKVKRHCTKSSGNVNPHFGVLGLPHQLPFDAIIVAGTRILTESFICRTGDKTRSQTTRHGCDFHVFFWRIPEKINGCIKLYRCNNFNTSNNSSRHLEPRVERKNKINPYIFVEDLLKTSIIVDYFLMFACFIVMAKV